MLYRARHQLLSLHRAGPDDPGGRGARRILNFLLVGAVVLVPLILAYTGYAYWVFRGKIDPEEGYH